MLGYSLLMPGAMTPKSDVLRAMGEPFGKIEGVTTKWNKSSWRAQSERERERGEEAKVSIPCCVSGTVVVSPVMSYPVEDPGGRLKGVG